MNARASVAVALLLVAAACATSNNEGEAPSASPDAGEAPADAATPVAEDAGRGAADPDRVAASDYCESMATPFCAFYMRCGRMVAKDEAECRTVFVETCNARFEPRYVDLEKAGLLVLSRAGMDACTAHLGQVACVEQAGDLDGPCAHMWKGTSAAKKPCGIDVESFVCGAGTTCILGLDFCGTCEAAAVRGGACDPGNVRCQPEDACVNGTCVARALPGQACSDTKPCLTGATCTNGTCVAPAIVGEGEACDMAHRCAYRSVCTSGTCVRTSLLGGPCATSRDCTSGRCEGSTCVALRADGETCASSAECSSAQCVSKKCAPLPSACFTK